MQLTTTTLSASELSSNIQKRTIRESVKQLTIFAVVFVCARKRDIPGLYGFPVPALPASDSSQSLSFLANWCQAL